MHSHWRTYGISILFLAAAAYFTFLSLRSNNHSTAISDVHPGTNRAALEMASGRIILTDTAATGVLALQGSTRISKKANGDIIYSPAKLSASSQIAASNTISTPKGGQCKVVLPDGTSVWLNAASAITFPTAFTGKERRVAVKGEAFFNVAHDAGRPFYVKTYRDFVTGSGGQFNVNCYDDERFIKTSLLQGDVMVNGNRLHPNEAFENGLVIRTDAVQDGDWKDGKFNFDGVFMEEAMRQISRWYGVDMAYDLGGLPVKKLTGVFDRSMPLQTLINQLARQSVIFRLDGSVLHAGPITLK